MAKANTAAEQLDRPAIDARREKLLDSLSFQKARRKQLVAAIPTGGASHEKVTECDQSILGIERELEGLGYVSEQVDAKEKEQAEVEKAASRRERAVDILSLMHLRHWAAEKVDEDVAAVRDDTARVDELGQQIILISSGCFAGDSLGQNHLHNFLGGIGAYGLTDIVYRVQADIDRDAGGYARGLPFTRQQALRALATALPEVMDGAVQKEALERARRVVEERNEGVNDDQDS